VDNFGVSPLGRGFGLWITLARQAWNLGWWESAAAGAVRVGPDTRAIRGNI
jgi:hypothetical protein